MEETWILNPKTGRPVRIKGDTYNRLVNQGVIENKHIDKDLVYTMKPGDNHKNIMYQLRKTTPVNQNQVLRLKDGQVRRVYKGGPKPARGRGRGRSEEQASPEDGCRARPHGRRLRDTEEWTNSKMFKYFSRPHNVKGYPLTDTETSTDEASQRAGVLHAIDTLPPPNLPQPDTEVTETDNIFED